MEDVSLGNREGFPTPFTAMPPAQLNSWTLKTKVWEDKEELPSLLERVQHFIDKKVTLIDVMYVALYRGVQPLQA